MACAPDLCPFLFVRRPPILLLLTRRYPYGYLLSFALTAPSCNIGSTECTLP